MSFVARIAKFSGDGSSSTLTGNVTTPTSGSGSLLVSVAYGNQGGQVDSVIDTAGNIYVFDGWVDPSTASGRGLELWRCAQFTALGGSDKVTVKLSSTQDHGINVIVEQYDPLGAPDTGFGTDYQNGVTSDSSSVTATSADGNGGIGYSAVAVNAAVTGLGINSPFTAIGSPDEPGGNPSITSDTAWTDSPSGSVTGSWWWDQSHSVVTLTVCYPPGQSPAGGGGGTVQPGGTVQGVIDGLSNNAEGIAPGTVPTSGNSGGPAGDAFNIIRIQNGATVAADATHPVHGTSCWKFATSSSGQSSAYVGWDLGTTYRRLYFRMDLYLPARPLDNGIAWRLIRFTGPPNDTDSDWDDFLPCGSVVINDDGYLEFWNACDDPAFTFGTITPAAAPFRIEGFIIGAACAGQLSLSLYIDPDSTTPAETRTSGSWHYTRSSIQRAYFGHCVTEVPSLEYFADDLAVSWGGPIGPAVPLPGYELGTFADGGEKIIGTLIMPDGDAGTFTEAYPGPASGTGPVADVDDSPVFIELQTAPVPGRLLPQSIPGPIFTMAAPPAPQAGSGWEVRVRSHSNFHDLLAYIPRYTSLQFAKMLNDKGSGTITLAMDDTALWPVQTPVTLGGSNYSFAGGSVAGWSAYGGTITGVQSGGGETPYAARLDSAGTSSGPHIYGGGSFPVTAGQGYQVTCYAMSPVDATVMVGLDWLSLAQAYQSNSWTSVTLKAGVWTPVTSAALKAPETGFAYPRIGLYSASGAVASGSYLLVQQVISSYDSGGVSLGDLLLDYEHLWQVYYDSKLVHEFLGETVTEQLADSSEQRVATITGPGGIAVLGWGRAMPPGFPDIVFKTDAIQDGFAELNTAGVLTLDTNIWNLTSPAADVVLSPAGTARLNATPGTTYMGGGPYDITSSAISAQVGPMTAPDLDGSQLTQFFVQSVTDTSAYAMIALSGSSFYAQVGDNGGRTVTTKSFSSYDAGSDAYWQITEKSGVFYFWTSADGQTWVKQWEQSYSWDATKINVFFAATYDTSGSQFVTVTNLNGDIVTPTSQGNVFFDQPIMGVWHQLLQACQARGTVPMVSTLASETADSYGNPWPDSVSVQIQNGTDLLSLLQSHASMVNADYVMQPGFILDVGMQVQGASGLGVGSDKSKLVVLREGRNVTTKQRVRARDKVANMTGGVNSDGTVVSSTDQDSIGRYGQREGWVQTAQTVNPQSMDVVVAASLKQSKDEVLSQTVQAIIAPGAVPFQDYDVGDWVGLERPGNGLGVVDAVRVIAIAIGIDATGTVTCEVTINTYRQYLDEQLQYLVDKFGGQFIDALGTTPVTSTSASPTGSPTVVAPNLGGLGNVTLS